MSAGLITKLGVSGILINNRQVLLGKRSANDEALPGLWCTPGGGVEPGETLEDALVREFFEETGYAVKGNRIITVQERLRPYGTCVLIFSTVTQIHPIKAHPKTSEFDEIEWCSLDRLFIMRREITDMTWQALCRITDELV